jgi:hypothetical protein
MPGSKDDDTRLVLSCAKANNCRRFDPRGLIFEEESFAYTVDPDFDADAWQLDVEGRARPGQSLGTVADVASAVADGYSATKDLVTHLIDAFVMSKRSAERLLRRAVQVEAIKPLVRGKFTLGRKSEKYLDKKTYES